MSFNDFVHEHNLKNKATSNIKVYQVFSSLSLNDERTYLGDGPFDSDIGIVTLHLSKEVIGFFTLTKIILLHVVDRLLKSYSNSL